MGARQGHVRQSGQRNDDQDIGPPSDDLLQKLHTLNPSLVAAISTRQIEPNGYLGFGNNPVRNFISQVYRIEQILDVWELERTLALPCLGVWTIESANCAPRLWLRMTLLNYTIFSNN
jgi:hypothetical protein